MSDGERRGAAEAPPRPSAGCSVDPAQAVGSPRRLLVVTNLYPGGVTPGRGVFVAAQVESLRCLGHDVDVIAIDGARDRREYLRGVARMRAAMRRKRYDLVHAHYGLTGLVARCQRAVPLVVSLLGSDLMVPWQCRLSRLAAREADFCVAMSGALKAVARVAHCVVLPNGTDLARFRPLDPLEARRRLGWPPHERIALFPWNPARPEKDFALAAAAVEAANAAAADPRDRFRLVDFHGRAQEEYALALNASDVCLLTSRHEGSPNAVREALAVGLPVVAVDAGDAWELIEGVAFCTRAPRQARLIGEGLTEIARRRRAAEASGEGHAGGGPAGTVILRHEGRPRAESHSLPRVACKLSFLYECVLAGRRDGTAVQLDLDALDAQSDGAGA